MWRRVISSQPATGILALQNHAERSGYALACSFSSSAEFEAAVIRARRDSGVYWGRRRRRALAGYLAAAIGAVIILVLLF